MAENFYHLNIEPYSWQYIYYIVPRFLSVINFKNSMCLTCWSHVLTYHHWSLIWYQVIMLGNFLRFRKMCQYLTSKQKMTKAKQNTVVHGSHVSNQSHVLDEHPQPHFCRNSTAATSAEGRNLGYRQRIEIVYGGNMIATYWKSWFAYDGHWFAGIRDSLLLDNATYLQTLLVPIGTSA